MSRHSAPRVPEKAELARLRRRDPALAAAMRRLPRFPGFPRPRDRRTTTYESLARAICFQQLHGKAASTIHARLCALTPGARFPKPGELERLSDEQLRGAGLSRAKLLSIRDLAAHFRDGRIRPQALAARDDEEIVEQLVAVRGIGRWSAQMFLLFQLGRLDVMPATDLGVQEGIKRLDGRGERPTPKAALDRAEPWRPLRSVGAWLMWRLAEEERAA